MSFCLGVTPRKPLKRWCLSAVFKFIIYAIWCGTSRILSYGTVAITTVAAMKMLLLASQSWTWILYDQLIIIASFWVAESHSPRRNGADTLDMHWVLLCFILSCLGCQFLVVSCDPVTHIRQGCFAWLPQCQWRKPERYAKINWDRDPT